MNLDCFRLHPMRFGGHVVAALLAMTAAFAEARYSAACCATVGSVPATVARRMSRGCDWS